MIILYYFNKNYYSFQESKRKFVYIERYNRRKMSKNEFVQSNKKIKILTISY